MARRSCVSWIGALAVVPALAACQRPGPAERALVATAAAAPRSPSPVVPCPAPEPSGFLPIAPLEPPFGNPTAIVDLSSAEALTAVSGEWRYSDVTVREVAGKSVGPDLKPSGSPNRTLDYFPKAHAADFDDSKWAVIAPSSLLERRGNGKLSFGWYRLRATIPDRIGDRDPTGMTVAFEIVVDDYAEVWVNGTLGAVLGKRGAGVVGGFNAPNRVVLTRDARPGQRFSVAVFGINGPISQSPDNFLWVRSATLDFHVPAPASSPGFGRVEALEPALERLVPAGAVVEKLASGFQFTEGPAWNRDEGSLFFSDPNANTVYRYQSDGSLSVARAKSGYQGIDIGKYHQPGSNGLAFDREGRLTLDEHGNRRVTRVEKNGVVTVLAARFEDKRLNSPNDLVYKSDGSLYFTDPPFGLPNTYEDPAKELPFSGIFRVRDGELRLLAKDLKGPNGLAFSPDERHLYVSNWDTAAKVVMRYAVATDGTLGAAERFFDLTDAPGEEALDGVKVDELGNVYVSGPGGVWIVSPEGKRLGVVRMAELPANFAWGDADRRALYLTARSGLYRLRLRVAGATAFAN